MRIRDEPQTRTFKLTVVMDAVDEWDFIEALNQIKDRELVNYHIEEVKGDEEE